MSDKKVKDTVRQRKRNMLANTQRFLPIAEIRSDTVLLKNGGLRAVILVEALNFNLKSETEQIGIISGYESFVNTLDFPLQIVIRSSKMNIDPYLNQLRSIANTHTNELLKAQTYSYTNFIERLVDVAGIMQKRFYVVVPLDQSAQNKGLLEQFFSWMRVDDSTAKAMQRSRSFREGNKTLGERVNLVQTGLGNIGLQTHRLTTQELVELYYQIYNPQTSQEQKLPEEAKLKTQKDVL